MMGDPPLEELPDGGSYHGVVIDLAGIRMQLGRTPYRAKACKHEVLVFCPSERRIWCKSCERTIDSFDAFMHFANHFGDMLRDANLQLHKANEALKTTARLRAVKVLDRMWSGNVMAPSCPHCKGGLLPEDFADGAASSCSEAIERQRRKAQQAKP